MGTNLTRLATSALCLLFLVLPPAPAAQQASTALAPAAPQEGTALLEIMSAIADGQGSSGRRNAILSHLRAAGIEFELQEFVDRRMRQGTNVVVTLPGPDPAARTLLLGAHYDRVAVGQGVVDNGAACAALIHLLGSLETTPLGRHTLKVVFFDLEEAGLSGSQAYFAQMSPGNRPAYAVNLDIFAYGDSIFATASQPDGALLRALRAAGSALGIPVRDVPVATYPGSDHQSMIATGIETLGVALVDAADIDGVLAAGPLRSSSLGTGPRIFSIIHTPRDTLAEARPADMAKAIPALERLIRSLDRGE